MGGGWREEEVDDCTLPVPPGPDPRTAGPALPPWTSLPLEGLRGIQKNSQTRLVLAAAHSIRLGSSFSPHSHPSPARQHVLAHPEASIGDAGSWVGFTSCRGSVPLPLKAGDCSLSREKVKPKGPQPRSQVVLSPTTGHEDRAPRGRQVQRPLPPGPLLLLEGQLSPWAALAGGEVPFPEAVQMGAVLRHQKGQRRINIPTSLDRGGATWTTWRGQGEKRIPTAEQECCCSQGPTGCKSYTELLLEVLKDKAEARGKNGTHRTGRPIRATTVFSLSKRTRFKFTLISKIRAVPAVPPRDSPRGTARTGSPFLRPATRACPCVASLPLPPAPARSPRRARHAATIAFFEPGARSVQLSRLPSPPAPNGAFLEAKVRVVFLPAPGAEPSVLGVRGEGRVKPPRTQPRQTPGSNPPAAVSAPAPGWTSPRGQRPGASLPRRGEQPEARRRGRARTEAGGLERRPAPASCRRGGGLRVSGGAGRVRPAQSPTRPTRLARDTRGTK
ncbi:hypothetical protein J1605_018493 [Eschrichtius robustus]|uniref:Uncharacterized protein n=1 Tax=Eschrichtius robustus TaxID=9764 RepID=A0AB34HTV2_ESCRO|nr:hypothetical protein J1605_018493 [Eschrichtius robustus]